MLPGWFCHFIRCGVPVEETGTIPPAATRELDELGRAFNTMNTNLAAAHGALALQASQREAILDSLADAVLAFDARGRVILANPPGETLWTASEPALNQAVQETLTTGKPPALRSCWLAVRPFSCGSRRSESCDALRRDQAGASTDRRAGG